MEIALPQRIKHVQNSARSLGRAMSAMVMPNIGCFIAWGLFTAFFIPTGWYPNPQLARVISPMLTYLLPILIAYTAGKNIAGERGGVIATIATMGIIVGSDIPMFIGAMAMGPFAGYILKEFDKWTKNRIKPGFEMLVNNFSIGIIGMLLAILGFLFIGNVVTGLTHLLAMGVETLIRHGLLPLVSLLIEPAKVLFLNNAINHGIFSPIGIEQARLTGQSILFLLETNPGPGVGVLLAYWLFNKGSIGKSAPGAIIIQFFGGIHEIYFPYILAKPILIIAPILGNMVGMLFFVFTGSGLVAPASPGSIFAVLAMAPKGTMLFILEGVILSASVSFFIASFFVKRANQSEISLRMEQSNESIIPRTLNKIVFCCDAGMGSSALGAAYLRRRLTALEINIGIENCAINALPEDADVVICQRVLAERIKTKPHTFELLEIDNFINDTQLDKLVDRLKITHDHVAVSSTLDASSAVLPLKSEDIRTGILSESKEKAIRRAGEMLYQAGYVQKDYIEAMLEREQLTTTYLGNGIAIPHGTAEAKNGVLSSGLVMLQYPKGVDFGEEKAYLVIGLACVGDDHIDIMAKLCELFENEALLHEMITAKDPDILYNLIQLK